MDACDVLKKVLQLKLQLTESTETKTVLKILKKLQELDITIDILAETGIGKAVNSLRKHGDAGEAAKLLVSHWKKMVPKETLSHSEKDDASQSKHLKTEVELKNVSKECADIQDKNISKHEGFRIAENQDGHNSKEEHFKSVEKNQGTSKEGHFKTENKYQGTAEEGGLKTEDKTQSTSKYDHLKTEDKKTSTLEKTNLQGVDQDSSDNKNDHFKSEKENTNALKKEHLKKYKVKGEGLGVSEKNKNGRYSETVMLGSRKSKSSQKKVTSFSREECKNNLHNRGICGTKRDSCRETRPCPKASKPNSKESLTLQPDKSSVIDNFSDQDNKESKRRETSGHSGERRKPSERKQVYLEDKEKTIHEGKSKTKEKMVKIIEDEPKEIDVEGPSMSFESFLSYDIGVSKRKKKSEYSKPPKKLKTLEKVKVVKALSAKSDEQLPEMMANVSPKKAMKGSVMDLLNIPLPTFLPEYDELSNFNYYDSKIEEKYEVSDVSEEAPVFTGQRLNRKMQVYSGAKAAFLPTMMSLYQQCIRALQNNIDLLYEIGGVPFEILEPVLERCTPDQLLRIEECNPVYIGLTDHLWEKHCQRDFRNAQLEEYESWREMYIRRSEERERKLQRLTKTIVSAHSGKPKGRQVKLAFINSVAKPPRNVRIQQEIHGTARHPKLQQEVHGTSGAPLKPQTQDIHSVKDNRARPCYGESQRPSSIVGGTSQAQDLRKKTRVAPMMAKSLKAFKNMGRR